MNSPFSDRGMITDPNCFFGRAAETQKIFNALAGPKPQCVSIIGERRIGRSSLLQHILRSYPQHLLQPDRYRFAYLDLARDTCGCPEQFYAEAAQAFGGNVTNKLSPQQFDDWLDNQNPQRAWWYIILLDEFNALQRRREQFDDDFYDGLRSRANAGEITFVLASHIPLHEVALENNFSSTFFGIFTPVDLNEFSHSEARESILRPVTTPLRLEDFNAIRQWVRDNDSGTYHPLKLNIAADLVWQALPRPNYAQIKTEYEKDVAYAFGEAVHSARRRKKWWTGALSLWHGLVNSIHWVTGEKPYLILIPLLVLLLILCGIINWDQLRAVVLDWGGIPTLTPTPPASPLPTPTP